MSFFQVLAEAFRAMGMNRLRTALTMLGMIIGVGAVVLMLAIGQGAQSKVNASIASMGSNLFIVVPGSTSSSGVRFGFGNAQTLTVADANALGQVPSVATAAPVVLGQFQLVAGNNNWRTSVFGVTAAYFTLRSWDLETGDMFGDEELRTFARVAVIGQTIAANLFPDEDPLGKIIRIRNSPYTVVGMLTKKGQSLDGRDQDDGVFVPLPTARQQLMRSSFPGSVNMIMAQARTAAQMPEAEFEMAQLLRIRHRLREGQEDDFSLRNMTAIAETAAVAARAMSLMLGAIASISLLVGGIGIMNIMLVSVTERTREIGIRMALGARKRDILLQFLTEAVVQSVFGGALGVALGVGGGWAVAQLAEMPVEVTAMSIVVAFGFAAAIGIFFGFYPARKAALLRPVEALRYE
ncbi:MAG: ABC transporter permease [Betaproteobacteria bacterium]|nr:ABC transporter permease [Betaproteobacteria bacterium]